jgi:hypothetical protein
MSFIYEGDKAAFTILRKVGAVVVVSYDFDCAMKTDC